MAKRLKVLLMWRFWLNYAAILVLTCWVPVLSQTMVMTTQEGKEVSRQTVNIRAYHTWKTLVTEGPGTSHDKGVLIHGGLCLAVTFAVWFALAGNRESKPAEEPSGENTPAPPRTQTPGDGAE